MAVVKMLSSYMSNVTGDVCGYPDDVAGTLVKRGLAVYYAEQRVPVVTKAAPESAPVIQAAAALLVATGAAIKPEVTDPPAPEPELAPEPETRTERRKRR